MPSECHLKELNFDNWDNLIKRTLQLKHNVSYSIPNLENIIKELKKEAEKGSFSENVIKNKDYGLALLNLWSSDYNFVSKVPFSDNLFLKILETRNNNISTLILYYIIDIYFFQYDLLKEQANILIKAIKKSLSQFGKNSKDTNLQAKYKNASFLFDTKFETHEKIAKNTVSRGSTLSSELLKYELFQMDNGRFFEQIRKAYYIQYVEHNDLLDCKDMLNEIFKEEIYKKDYKNGWNVGHNIIHILLQKLETHIFGIKKYQFVTNFIIKIAGDPRINKSNINYQNWWLVLGEDDIARMKKCLSGFDLELFLEIYGEFAEKENTYDQKKMFAERKKFLQGMLMQNLIHETKLFIGKSMISFLKEHYKQDELPRYHTIKDDPTRAVIFMRYNEQLFTEGSFNCYFHAYTHILPNSPWNTIKNEYSYRELNIGLAERYNSSNVFEKVHNGDWQSSVIYYFKRNTKERIDSNIFYKGIKR